MGNKWMEEQVQLQKYRFKPDLIDSFPVIQLLDEEFLKNFLKKLTKSIGAPNEKAAASILMKRYAFVAVMSLYTMTVWNKRLDVSLNNIKMEGPGSGQDWLPSFSFTNAMLQPWDEKDRPCWRKDIVNRLFAENIGVLINQLEKTVGISSLILWENIAVYLFWLYETELKGHPNGLDDFAFLLFQAEGRMFGAYKQNPIQKYYGMKTHVVEWNAEVRIRRTCCFSYQLQAGKRCKTCPCMQKPKDGGCQDGEGVYCSIRSIT